MREVRWQSERRRGKVAVRRALLPRVILPLVILGWVLVLGLQGTILLIWHQGPNSPLAYALLFPVMISAPLG